VSNECKNILGVKW